MHLCAPYVRLYILYLGCVSQNSVKQENNNSEQNTLNLGSPRTPKCHDISILENLMTGLVSSSGKQLELEIEIEKDVAGIEMGVLENGMPYLTQAGLAKAAGVVRSTIYDITQEWEDNYDNNLITKDRISYLKTYLLDRGFDEKSLYITIKKNGSTQYAYPSIVCTAILEYYAFEAKSTTPEAITTYRTFASKGLEQFIYDCLEYNPISKWQAFHDRVSILNNAVPAGYFSIFDQVGGLIVDLINEGMPVGAHTIPDGSVGKVWSPYWSKNDLAAEYGERTTYKHVYPSYFGQSKAGCTDAFAYPDSALAHFRRWFKESYLVENFPKYILNKRKDFKGGVEEARRVAKLYENKGIDKD